MLSQSIDLYFDTASVTVSEDIGSLFINISSRADVERTAFMKFGYGENGSDVYYYDEY